MSEKLIELNCMSCNKTFLGEEPEYCCNGNVLKWAFYPESKKLIIFNDYANAIITYNI